MSKTHKANQMKREITAGRQRILDLLTADGKTPLFDSVWSYLKAAELVNHCTKTSFRDSIYKHGMGMKDGRMFDRRLSINNGVKKKKRVVKTRPVIPLYVLSDIEQAYNRGTKYLRSTFL